MRKIIEIFNDLVNAQEIRELDICVDQEHTETSISFVVGYIEFLPDEPFLMWVFPATKQIEIAHAGKGKCETKITLTFDGVLDRSVN